MRGGEAINYVPINRFQVCRPGDAKDISFHSHCSTKICSSVEQLCHWGEDITLEQVGGNQHIKYDNGGSNR